MPITIRESDEIPIKTEGDIVVARRTIRDAATTLGFGQTDVARIVTASSELARNVFRYAGEGLMRWKALDQGERVAIEIQFIDHGPGIPDISLAMKEGYSSGGGMGMGLPGAKRLVDELEIESVVGQGTTVTLRKWRRNDPARRV
jgi:serine/threonine-protein kinase RsbT